MSDLPEKQVIVLVVEHDPLLRLYAVDLVEGAGFEAVEATASSQAIEILECNPDVRVVFSDIDMPSDMDGVNLAALVRRRWPSIEFILTSSKLAPKPEDIPAGSVFISKPYREQDVVRALHRVIA